jgi:predicted amidohydrolase
VTSHFVRHNDVQATFLRVLFLFIFCSSQQNLFMGEDQFNAPKEPEIVTFNTTFGKFGIFTCFDILFHDPAVTLVKDFHVDTILFPTASNIHLPGMRMTGSMWSLVFNF